MKKLFLTNFVLQKLGKTDCIILSVFLALIIIRYSLNLVSIPNRDSGLNKIMYEIAVSFILVFSMVGPLSIRFRNVLFMIAWLLLGFLYFLTDTRPLTCMPFILFFLYHIIRVIFGSLYKIEYIPCNLSRSKSYPYFSHWDNRESSNRDAVFTRLYFFAAFISSLASIFLSGHQVTPH